MSTAEKVTRVEGKFLYLLIALLSVFVIYPFFQDKPIGTIVLDVLLLAMLAAGIYTVINKKIFSIIALLLVIPMLGTRWSNYFFPDTLVLEISYGFGAMFFLFNTITVLAHIMPQERITRDIIFGGVCGYLLLGFSWAFAFSLVELLEPGAFAITSSDQAVRSDPLTNFFYYSFVTLTTLGYGDITPVAPFARAFSALEAVIGQIYLVVLIARLVGVHVSQAYAK